MCKVLLVEDCPVQQLIIRTKLTKEAFEVVVVHTVESALCVLSDARCSFDVVILDLGLPDSSGVATFDALKGVCEDTPIIVVTAEDSITIALECIRRGAETVMVKPNLEPLPRQVAYATERANMRRDLERRIAKQVKDLACGYNDLMLRAKENIVQSAEMLGTLTEEKAKWGAKKTNC